MAGALCNRQDNDKTHPVLNFIDENIPVHFPGDVFADVKSQSVAGFVMYVGAEPEALKFVRAFECRDRGATGSDKEIPSEMSELLVPAAAYVIFTCVGKLPESQQEVWKRIFTEKG